MRKLSLTLLIIMASCFACSPKPIPTLPPATPNAVCSRPFREVIDWTNVVWPPEAEAITTTEWEEMMSIIVPQVIEAGEVFLDNCTNSEHPLSYQMGRLYAMTQLATMIGPPDTLPPNWTALVDSAQVQLVNLDNDEAVELILVSKALASSRGAFQVVYNLREDTQTWHGTLVWPHINDDYALFNWPRFDPIIRPLRFNSKEDQTFVLVEGAYGGANHTAKHLWIWQWKESHLEITLKIRLSDWCGYSEWDSWEATEEGILVHAADTSWRCEAREATLYYLEPIYKQNAMVTNNCIMRQLRQQETIVDRHCGQHPLRRPHAFGTPSIAAFCIWRVSESNW